MSISDSYNGGGMQTSTQSHDQGVDSGEPVKRKRGRPRKKVRGRPPGSRSKPKTPLSPSGSGGSGFTPHINTVTAGEVISETGGVISNCDSYNGGGMQTSTQSHSSGGAAHSMSAGEGSAGGSFVHDQGVDSGEPMKHKRGRPREYSPGTSMPMNLVPISVASPNQISDVSQPSSAVAQPQPAIAICLPAGGSFVHDQGVISGEPVKRKRGKPRKCNPGTSGEPVKVKRKRGRPKKEVPPEGWKPSNRNAKKRRHLSNRMCASDEDRKNAHNIAEKLQSSFDPDIPSFVKPMLQSHVTGEFWLDLPVEFCKTYLPEHDETVTLVDKKGWVFLTKYLALKTGLSAGWKGFVIEHELIDGDVLVFQMIKPSRFNVDIIKCELSLKRNE